MKRFIAIASISTLMILLASIFVFQPAMASRTASQDGAGNSEPRVPADTQITDAASPPVFSYQGQLTDSAGNPINNAALPMKFRLFTTLTGGTACWTENQNVSVQNGQFGVLLGQTTSIPASCLGGANYLELVVNGETLTPRELLTSVPYAIQANTLPANATTLGSLTTGGDLTVGGWIRTVQPQPNMVLDNGQGNVALAAGDNLKFYLDTNRNSTDAAMYVYRDSFYLDPAQDIEIMRLTEGGDLSVAGRFTTDSVLRVNSGVIETMPGAYALTLDNASGTSTRMVSGEHLMFFMDANDDSTSGGFHVYTNSNHLGGNIAEVMAINENGDMGITGNLTIGGTCTQTRNGSSLELDEDCASGTITSGAYVEANLMTNEERAADTVERFERGDLLCWSSNDQQLELCAQANARLVMAVADANGKPIVLGAEPVKVIGPVVAGDLLVSSDSPGYAMVNNNPLPGTVIGQALEDLDGESGVVKAMIRKW